MEINSADVAELVDARDLECLATLECSHLFWKTRSRFRHQRAGMKRDFGKTFFGGPLMALRPTRSCARVAATTWPQRDRLRLRGRFQRQTSALGGARRTETSAT